MKGLSDLFFVFALGAFVISPSVIYTNSVSAPCSLKMSLDIKNGVYFDNGTLVSNNVSYPRGTYFEHKDSIRGCICNVKRCIRKCCEIGQAMVNKTCQPYSNDFQLKIYNQKEPMNDTSDNYFYYLSNKDCGGRGSYRLFPTNFEDEFYIQSDGNMYMPAAAEEGNMLHPEQYCMEMFIDEEMNGNVSGLVCFPEEHELEAAYSVGMIISMVFLLLTFIVYALLPDRNLHGKALMCYVITLFGAYLILVLIQLFPGEWDSASCKTLGLSCLFFFMVSFFWMNVMSIDIWWAFSGLRGFSGSKKQAERKRFLLYSAYAWGMPLLHVVLVICLTFSTSLPPFAWYNPGMGEGKCWFREGIPTLVYFYGPMAILIIANITLFIITACKIKQVQQDTAMLRKDESKKHTYENDKQRFNLYLKLMLAMGVNWVMEIISWAVIWKAETVPPAVWYLTDFINALYGVLIFFIFVFKRNILKLLKRRYYMVMGKPHLARSMTQTAYSPRTTGSSLSQTVTTDTKGFVNDSSVLTSEVA